MEEQKWTNIVRAKKGLFDIDIKSLADSGDLIKLFVRRTFVAKYKQTILGPAWAVIQPFFTTVVYSVFFGDIAGLGAAGIPNFIFYLSGTILWTLFANSLTQTSETFIGNSGILGKVYFPRLVIPIANTVSQYIAFAIQFAFMLIFFAYYMLTDAGLVPNIYMIMLPLVILQLSVLGMSFGIIISSLTTKYRDLQMLVGFGVTLWSYCSPVAYDMFSRPSLAPGGSMYALYMLNPVTPAINIFRFGFLGVGTVDWVFYGISWITTALVLLAGVLMFGKTERTFADTV